MALSKFTFAVTWKGRKRTHGVYDVEFPDRQEFVPQNVGKPLSGRILSKGKGFPLDTSLPGVDFKIIRSMLAAGLSDEATFVLQNYHRSVIHPDRVWDMIMNFSHATPPKPTDELYQKVLDQLRDQLKVDEKIKPCTLEEARDELPRSTNPGFPYIETDPGKKKGEIFDKYFPEMEKFWDQISENRDLLLPDCAAFARSNVSAPEFEKVRCVWAYPIIAVLAESLFATPLIKLLKEQKIFLNTAYGMEMMCGGMEFLNNMCRKAKVVDPDAKFVMTDFSAFDSSVPAWLIRDCFAIIKEKFDFSDNPVYYSNIFRKIVAYFINTPIRNADGRRFQKSHGIPSGTMFTNIMGTMCNFVISRYITLSTTGEAPIFDIYFGDDAFTALRHSAKVNFNNMAFQSKKVFGVKLNVIKSSWTHLIENCHFLGYYNHHGTPYKTDKDLFSSMVYPQTSTDDWAYSLARAMGCLCASAGQNVSVFLTAQQVYFKALRSPGKVDEAVDLIRNQPRMKRFIKTMGLDPQKIGVNILTDIRKCIPSSTCTKLMYSINLVKDLE